MEHELPFEVVDLVPVIRLFFSLVRITAVATSPMAIIILVAVRGMPVPGSTGFLAVVPASIGAVSANNVPPAVAHRPIISPMGEISGMAIVSTTVVVIGVL